VLAEVPLQPTAPASVAELVDLAAHLGPDAADSPAATPPAHRTA